MTILQYTILTLLETKGEIKAKELVDRIGEKDFIIMNDLNALLFSPSFNPKRQKNIGIINANFTNDDKPEITPDHIVSINKDFMPNSLKISCLPGVYKKPKDQAEEQERNEAMNMKAYQNMLLDACLTRIMKGRIGKKTTHLELVNEAAKQIEMFVAQPNQIKDRIETLIGKGIIKRNENDHNLYEYIS